MMMLSVAIIAAFIFVSHVEGAVLKVDVKKVTLLATTLSDTLGCDYTWFS